MGRLDKSPKNLLKLCSDMYRLGLFEDVTAEKYKSGGIAAAVLYLSSGMGMFITGHICDRWRTDHQLTRGGQIL